MIITLLQYILYNIYCFSITISLPIVYFYGINIVIQVIHIFREIIRILTGHNVTGRMDASDSSKLFCKILKLSVTWYYSFFEESVASNLPTIS